MKPKNAAGTIAIGILSGVLLALIATQGVTAAAAPDRRAEQLVQQGNVIPPDVLEYGRR